MIWWDAARWRRFPEFKVGIYVEIQLWEDEVGRAIALKTMPKSSLSKQSGPTFW